MQGMKGRFLKNLKFIPSINSLKQGLSHLKSSNQKLQSPPPQLCEELDHRSNYLAELAVDHSTGLSEHVKDVKVEEDELEFNVCNKENVIPSTENVMEQESMHPEEEENDENNISALDFEEKCPPGGEELVILYTTSLRGIRKTFEDCHSIRFLLENLRVSYYERDVSFHMEYREELWRILGGRVIPPKLFIKGRYIGGADEVIGLHEQGKLKKLLEGIPVQVSNRHCNGCGNRRFVVCLNCNGSRKVFTDGEGDDMFVRCLDCNENGLVKCPICC